MSILEKKKAEAKARLPEAKYPEHLLIDLPSGRPPVTVKRISAEELFGGTKETLTNFEASLCDCGAKGNHAHD